MLPRGLYAVTPDGPDTAALVSTVTAALTGGARIVQYRNKPATPELRRDQAAALKRACDAHGALLIINDHAELAREIDAAGVHIGADDGDVAAARRIVGRDSIIGVSCYRRIELAREAEAQGADYIAFGSFFPSSVKPGAVRAPVDLLLEAKRALAVPVVAIGGITIDNAPQLIAAGADAVAVITAVFGASDVAAAARAFTALYATERSR
jgi:thiamine-phosphate pyrophosphorylase